ncbi:MAG: MFS transporter [Candidatus Lokiarchaeota archaeon]|nr:MFS transporter [Candidatus Lokiarchaeota archaeon]
MENQNKKQLSSRNLWGYALGAIPNGLLVFIFGLKYIELFFDKLQLDPTLFVIGQVIYLVINAINDPLLGQMSDRTNPKKWGSRRTIYIKYGAPIWALTFMIVWFPWSFDNQIIIFIHFIISICLFDTFFTLVVLVWMALMPEMTSDLDERNKANLLATIVGAIFVIPMFIIVGAMDPTSSEFIFLMLIVAIFSTILLIVTAHLCEEKPEFQKDEGLPLIKAVKETLRLKSFLTYMGYIFCDAFVGSIGLSYLFVYLLVLGEGGLLFYFAIFFFIGYGSNIFCMKLRPKWGMRKILLRFGVLKAIFSFILFAIVVFVDVPIIVVIGLAIRTFLGGYTVFNTPILYLSIDEDELRNGSRREGMFIGMDALIHKPSQSIGPIVATFILGVFGYIQNSPVPQSDSALFGIKILMFLIPAIASTIGLIFMYFYPIHGEKLDDMREKLEALHMEKRGRIE